jgi:small multidrug resistance pump
MQYVYLSLAIVAEVIATSCLKASEQFTRFVPSLIVIVGYGVSFYLLSIVLRTLPVGIVYAMWSGVGIVLVAIVAFVLYRQVLDIPAMLGMALIIAGVATINLFSTSAAH